MPASELTDSCLDVCLLGMDSQHISQRRLNEETTVSQVHQLAAFLLDALVANRPQPDVTIQPAMRNSITSQDQVPMPRQRQTLQTSKRSFQRRFRHVVEGVPLLSALWCVFLGSRC